MEFSEMLDAVYQKLRDKDDKICDLEQDKKDLLQRVECAERRAEQTERERDEWRAKYEQAVVDGVSEISPSLLCRCILLSWVKIKTFASSVPSLNHLSFLQMFLSKTVDEEMGSAALESINKMVELPMPKSSEPKITNNFNAGVGTVVDYAEHIDSQHTGEAIL